MNSPPTDTATARAEGGLGHRAGVALLAGAPVMWGGAGAAGQMLAGVGQLTSVQIAASRAGIGGAALLIVTVLLRRAWPSGAQAWRHVAAMASLTVAYQSCFFAAIAAGSISVATLVTLGSAPVFVTAIESVRRRHLSVPGLLILALALTGLVLLVGPGPDGAPSLGVVVPALAAGLAFALLTLANAEQTPGYDPVSGFGVSLLLAGIALAIGATLLGSPVVPWSVPLVGWLVVLGVVCTAVPYSFYFTALPAASASLGALFTMLEPLVATLIAMLTFGERLTFGGAVGAALLLGAVGAAALRGPEH